MILYQVEITFLEAHHHDQIIIIVNQIWIPDEIQFQDSGTTGDIPMIQLNDPLNNNCNVTPFPSVTLLAGFYPFSGDYWISNH